MPANRQQNEKKEKFFFRKQKKNYLLHFIAPQRLPLMRELSAKLTEGEIRDAYVLPTMSLLCPVFDE